jgi:hypothetical protein
MDGGITMGKRHLGLAVAALAAASLFSSSQTDALTPWRTFGSATARGIGVMGRDAQGTRIDDTVIVGMDSTTRANPKRLRFVATGPVTGRAQISWFVDCWDPGGEFRFVDGTLAPTRLPRTVDLTNKAGGVFNWTLCTAGVRVEYPDPRGASRPVAGVVKVVLEARY